MLRFRCNPNSGLSGRVGGGKQVLFHRLSHAVRQPTPQPALAKGGWLAEGETGGFRQQPTRESSPPSGGHPLGTLSLPFGQPAPSKEGACAVAYHPQQCAIPKPEQLTLNGGTRPHSPPLPKGGGSPKARRGDSGNSQAGEQLTLNGGTRLPAPSSEGAVGEAD